jgi:hypothetical protein
MRTTVIALVTAFAAGNVPVPAAAQAVSCSDHATMVRHLAENWGESRQSVALDAQNAMVEVFASSETGTWTLTVTRPGGPTCMVASGHAFEKVDEPLMVLDEGA